MNESILKSLMQLYALIAYANRDIDSFLARSFVDSYLKQYFSKQIVEQQLTLFDFYIKKLEKKEQFDKDLRTSFSVGILKICEYINKELHQKQKLLVLINSLQFVKHWKAFSVEGFDNEDIVSEIIETIALVFKFDEQEYNNIKGFIYDQLYKMPVKKKVLIINDNDYFPITGINLLRKTGLKGQIFILHIESTNTYLFRYSGQEKLELSGKNIFPNYTYIFEKGTAIKGENFEPIYYSELVAKYLSFEDKLKISFFAKDIEYQFPNSKNGIQKLSFSGISGQMIGVMGGSGTGKSTLLNILNGNLKLSGGNISINGFDIYEYKQMLTGIIGYIPQEDLLIEELTVYQNLYYNAKLCFGNHPDADIREKVTSMLLELDLFEAKDLTVGSVLNKYISGGQRKRLNIALELIREPYILFVDEPTSGLSSTDSEKVIELLKEQVLKGKFLVVNIHQPSSNIFKQFDKLMIIDKGGFAVYFGDPVEAIGYVKRIAGMVDSAENECHCCGRVNPDQILEIIEYKDIDDYGEFSKKRKIMPNEWYNKYKENSKNENEKNILTGELPQVNFNPPNLFRQFNIFSVRNFKAKLADMQYMIIALLITPLLAVILGFLTKYFSKNTILAREYIFNENENIPAFLFMSIIVALFVGLTISAEEIIRDRKILKREAFLNLSKISYLNSKILFLFIISAIQTFLYIFIGNYILEIKGFTFKFGLVLFSLACFANLTGLNISAAFKSVVTIYILIPLILVPQILLSGVIVKFDKLHYSLAAQEYVPVVGDFMASRWAYEALMVTQFKENEYQKHYFDVQKKISESSFKLNYTIPELLKIKNNILIKSKDSCLVKNSTKNKIILYNEVNKLNHLYNLKSPGFLKEMRNSEFNPDIYISLNEYLQNIKLRLVKHIDKLLGEKDNINNQLISKMGKDEFLKFKQQYTNERLSEFVLNNREINRVRVADDKIIQLYKPIYLSPSSEIGRAQFFAPHKQIGEFQINTLWFNILVLWLFGLFLYLALVFDWLRKLIRYFER